MSADSCAVGLAAAVAIELACGAASCNQHALPECTGLPCLQPCVCVCTERLSAAVAALQTGRAGSTFCPWSCKPRPPASLTCSRSPSSTSQVCCATRRHVHQASPEKIGNQPPCCYSFQLAVGPPELITVALVLVPPQHLTHVATALQRSPSCTQSMPGLQTWALDGTASLWCPTLS